MATTVSSAMQVYDQLNQSVRRTTTSMSRMSMSFDIAAFLRLEQSLQRNSLSMRNAAQTTDAMSTSVDQSMLGMLSAFGQISFESVQVEESMVSSSSSMQRMTRSLEQMSDTMDKTASDGKKMTDSLDDAFKESDLKDKGEAAKKAANESEKKGSDPLAGLKDSIKNAAAELLSFDRVVQLAGQAISAAMGQERMKDFFIARTGSEEIGTAMFDKLKADALAAGQDVNQSLQGAFTLIPVVENFDQLDKLNQLTLQLNAFDISGSGIDATAESVKEAFSSGDMSSLADQFGISLSSQDATNFGELANKGDTAGQIAALDEIMEKSGKGKEALNTMLSTPANQLDELKNRFNSVFAEIGQGALDSITPLLQRLNEAFASGEFQVFINIFNAALAFASQLMLGLVNAVLGFGSVISQYLPEFAVLLMVIAASLIPAVITSLWGMIQPILVQAAAWALANWPIILIGLLIIGLIALLRSLGVSTEQIVGAMVGAFYALFAAINNIIAFLWNGWLTFVEFLANSLRGPINFARGLFYDFAMGFLGFMYDMAYAAEGFASSFMQSIVQAVNKALEGFNWLIDKVNGIFKTDFNKAELLDENNVHAVSDGIKDIMGMIKKPEDLPETDLSNYKMDYKNIPDAYNNGYEKGAGLYNSVASSLDGINFDFSKGGGETSLDNVDKVGEIGKINDSVDISSEDLKMMRELAEMKNIQNFVSLTPIVNVETGDINNGYDIDTIISRIERSLEEQISSSAEGVYA